MTASTATGPVSLAARVTPTPRRLAVAWQDPDSRSIQPVGLLSTSENRYYFTYVQNARELSGFVPFIGFPELDRLYSSSRLFPLFSQRIMDPRRPDYAPFVRMLDLSPEATPWEQLTRSEGRRSGDTIVLFPEPVVEGDGTSSCSFFVHGIRHMMKARPELEGQLDGLTRGASLALVDEPGNPVNPRALLTTTADRRHPLGWVPDVLLDFVHAVRDSGRYELVVRQVNNSDVPIHQRLLVRLAGRTPAGFIAFEGARWRPLARP